MFAGRKRANTKLGKETRPNVAAPSSSVEPQKHDYDEPNSLPESVTEIMNTVRLTWDFMMPQEVQSDLLSLAQPHMLSH
jgi:hypothetical protein